MEKFNAIVVGAGSIGALKHNKFDGPKTESILTHAHALYNHPDVNLIGIVDIDEAKAKKAAKKWSTKAYKSIFQIEKRVDIIAICTPTDFHYQAVMEAIQLKPRIIIGEKPFCNSVIDAIIAYDFCKQNDIEVAMDYIRRFDTSIQSLKASIDRGLFGEIYNARVVYTRGFKHEACHGIDLMRYFFGEYIEGVVGDVDGITDRDPEDPSVFAHMVFDKCPVVLFTPVDGRNYSVFEIDIWTEVGKICLVDHGTMMHIYLADQEKTYGNYLALPQEPTRKHKTELKTALLQLVDECCDYIKIGKVLSCTAEDAIAVQRIYKKVLGHE